MKRLLPCCLAGLLLAGCAPRYKIVLANDNEITTKGRPKLNKQKTAYHYTDLNGEKRTLPGFRVKEIAPLH